ncbi:MAG: threonine--tRNA ligase [Spirochaetota bacterium]
MKRHHIQVDGIELEVEEGKNLASILDQLSLKNRDQIVGIRIDSKIYDLLTPLRLDGKGSFITVHSVEALEILRHSTSHVLAQAVQHLFPGVKLAIGPAIKNGFYYDFDFQNPVTADDIEKIEVEMQRIIEADQKFDRFTMDRDEAMGFFQQRGERYKVELIKDLERDEEISLYRNGDFTDLCRGPHLPSTGYIKAFKILNLAGAYWRGDERNPMLTRIYGTSFFDNNELRTYLRRLEEAKRRDHRKLGKELELFTLLEEGPGFPFWLPNGIVLRNILLDFWREEHRKAGYVEVQTPILLKKDLWVQSGHWENYRDNMYLTEIDGYPFVIKPMNCPGGMLLYKQKIHSYRDFPQRVAEIGLVHRHEKSGVLQGLFRVRSFTQDDAHIFLLPTQIEEEVIRVIELTDSIYSVFGFDYHLELSTRPEKSIGTDEQWENATRGLENALKKIGRDYRINKGEGAFYGPKIDFHLEDCLGRLHQCATIQLDMSFPERFDLTFVNQYGKEERPVVIHRTVLGSIERFIGILIEHYGGRFPLWLAPVQVVVMSITRNHVKRATEVYRELVDAGFRVIIDDRNEKLGYKMREAEIKKVPYIVVIGERELKENTLSVRKGGGKGSGPYTINSFIQTLKEEKEMKK